jgi:hypothetical protein
VYVCESERIGGRGLGIMKKGRFKYPSPLPILYVLSGLTEVETCFFGQIIIMNDSELRFMFFLICFLHAQWIDGRALSRLHSFQATALSCSTLYVFGLCYLRYCLQQK